MNAERSALCLVTGALLACGPDDSGRSSISGAMQELAGTYQRGGHMMWTDSITLSPDGHFEKQFRGCAGAGSTHGTAALADGRLTLQVWDASGTEMAAATAGEGPYRIVTWGPRRYLIEDSLMQSFCHDVNEGWEPRETVDGSWLLRADDWKLPAAGSPDVGADWSPWLLRAELSAHVTELAGDGAGWIDLGREDGLLPGMSLTLQDLPMSQQIIDWGGPPTRDVPLEIASLESKRSLIRFKYPDNMPAAMAVSMRVTSRAIDRP